MTKRNEIVELMRFIFCIIVVGFHIQLAFSAADCCWFECGALGVEYFFVLSGLLLANSLERLYAKGDNRVIPNSMNLIWGRIRPVLPYHFPAIGLLLIAIAIWDRGAFVTRLQNGWSNIFLLQMYPWGDEGMRTALIVPEWYLSTMYMAMLLVVPLFLCLRRYMRGVWAVVTQLCLFVSVIVGVGLVCDWHFPVNFTQSYRTWLELSLGMFTYYLAQKLSSRNRSLCVLETITYCVPVLLGVLPISESWMPETLSLTVLCSILALSISFSGRGWQINSERAGRICGILGRLSLPIYIFHPVIIEAIRMALEK